MQTLVSFIPVWIWLILSALSFAGGEYASKKFALSPSTAYVVLTILLYAGSSLFWLPAILKTNQLALTGILWLLLAMIATIGMGVFMFGEPLLWYHWVGIIFAGLAIILLAI